MHWTVVAAHAQGNIGRFNSPPGPFLSLTALTERRKVGLGQFSFRHYSWGQHSGNYCKAQAATSPGCGDAWLDCQ